METQQQRVLVTGANGQIGRAVMERLADRYALRALTRRPAEFPSVIGDVTDLESILPAFDGIDAVIHLAASPQVQDPRGADSSK
ncbi:MAG: NAD-dependent epimerase/dehydratase family protein [Thermomicrobiales bacterium]